MMLLDRAVALVYTPQQQKRVDALARSLLVLLSLDLLATHVGPAWRYGAAGFSSPHFGVLRGLVPLSQAGYLAMLGGVALVSWTAALSRAWTRAIRVLLGIAGAFYTYGWAHSMLDSYQHHYLLSWVVLLLAMFPSRATDTAHTTEAPAYVAFCMLLAVVYGYTAITKYSAGWLDGTVVGLLTSQGTHLGPFAVVRSMLGTERALAVLGIGAFCAQIIIATAYASAPWREASAGLRRLGFVGWVCALSFHAFAEILSLEIGWFSYYMMVAATFVLAPDVCLRPWVWLGSQVSRVELGTITGAPALACGVLGAVVVVAVLTQAGMPFIGMGAAVAALAFASVLAAELLRSPRRFETAVSVHRALLTFVFVALATVVLSATQQRFDYYRFKAGDERRRGENEAARADYRQALRFAPEAERARILGTLRNIGATR